MCASPRQLCSCFVQAAAQRGGGAPQAPQHAPARLELIRQDEPLRALGLPPRGRRRRARRLLARQRRQALRQIWRGCQRVPVQAPLRRLQLPARICACVLGIALLCDSTCKPSIEPTSNLQTLTQRVKKKRKEKVLREAAEARQQPTAQPQPKGWECRPLRPMTVLKLKAQFWRKHLTGVPPCP